jgi:hypothetical protein
MSDDFMSYSTIVFAALDESSKEHCIYNKVEFGVNVKNEFFCILSHTETGDIYEFDNELFDPIKLRNFLNCWYPVDKK